MRRRNFFLQRIQEMVTNNKRRLEGCPTKDTVKCKTCGQASYWHEDDKKREQGLALLKEADEILASKKNNRAKIVATRAQCATTHKMHPHICHESNSSDNRYKFQSRIQNTTKTQRVRTRMQHAQVAQRCTSQKGANPRKRKLSEQSKDACIV